MSILSLEQSKFLPDKQRDRKNRLAAFQITDWTTGNTNDGEILFLFELCAWIVFPFWLLVHGLVVSKPWSQRGRMDPCISRLPKSDIFHLMRRWIHDCYNLCPAPISCMDSQQKLLIRIAASLSVYILLSILYAAVSVVSLRLGSGKSDTHSAVSQTPELILCKSHRAR